MMNLYPGMDVRLSCVSNGVPQPLLSWYRNGFARMNGSSGVFIADSGNLSELVVTDMMGQQDGEYSCNGTNVAGVTSVTFTVECKCNT